MINEMVVAAQGVLTFEIMATILLAGVFGIVMGALPGMTATLAVALVLPFTLFMSPVTAIAAIITMSATAIFAGDVPGALLRIPGTPSSAAYVDDAYLMTQSGRGHLALGGGLLASVLGGLFGTLVLILLAPTLGKFALRFTPYEYFWVAVLGLCTAVVVSQGSQLKGAVSLLLGLLVSFVGLDIMYGVPRFTFGVSELTGGINFIPVMIGLFGISQVMVTLFSDEPWDITGRSIKVKGMLRESIGGVWRYKGRLLTGSATGSVIGALPGAGSDIAAWVAYGLTKGTSKRGAMFGRGRGELEPIVGASSANNAAVGSAYVPALAFGIPGDSVTAIVIGVLLMKGITPGPSLFTSEATTLYSIYIVFVLANLVLLPLGFLAITASGAILRIPRSVLLAMIVAICIVGSFAINNSVLDVGFMLAFGIIGYFFTVSGIPLAPVVLGIILGPIVERSFMQGMIASHGDLSQFVTRPIAGGLMALVVVALLVPIVQHVVKVRARRRAAKDVTLAQSVLEENESGHLP